MIESKFEKLCRQTDVATDDIFPGSGNIDKSLDGALETQVGDVA